MVARDDPVRSIFCNIEFLNASSPMVSSSRQPLKSMLVNCHAVENRSLEIIVIAVPLRSTVFTAEFVNALSMIVSRDLQSLRSIVSKLYV